MREQHDDLVDVLSEFARTMVTDFPIQDILDHLVSRIVDVLPVTAAGVTLISPPGKPRHVAASNTVALELERLQSDWGEGPCVSAYSTDRPVTEPDLSTSSRFLRFASPASRAGVRAVFAFPLRHGDHRLGALDLYSDVPEVLNARAMRSAQTLADVAASYIVNAQIRRELRQVLELAHDRALHDELTGLPNRTLLLERLEQAFHRSRRSSAVSAVLFVDLDDFKIVNDRYGHSAGDDLLVALARRLTALVRPSDTVARLHGDEFVILCEDVDHPDQAHTIAGRIEMALSEPFRLNDNIITVAASVGVALSDRDAHAPEAVLRDADLAMYAAKNARRARQGTLAQ